MWPGPAGRGTCSPAARRQVPARSARHRRKRPPGLPRYAVCTARPGLVRLVVAPTGRLSCTSGTYGAQEAGTLSLYVQYGGSGKCVSAQATTSLPSVME